MSSAGLGTDTIRAMARAIYSALPYPKENWVHKPISDEFSWDQAEEMCMGQAKECFLCVADLLRAMKHIPGVADFARRELGWDIVSDD